MRRRFDISFVGIMIFSEWNKLIRPVHRQLYGWRYSRHRKVVECKDVVELPMFDLGLMFMCVEVWHGFGRYTHSGTRLLNCLRELSDVYIPYILITALSYTS